MLQVNEGPYGDGWLIKIKMSKPEKDLGELMSSAAYTEQISK